MVAANNLVLVSGPSRGGKSRWAESLLKDCPKVTYVATSAPRPNDPSWQARLELHKTRRPRSWNLLETTDQLPEDLSRLSSDQALLIDALGGFVASCLELDPILWDQRCQALIQAITAHAEQVVVVIEETGWGVVPATAIGGLFRDRIGALAQQLEQHSKRSWLVVQGRALDLHALGIPV